MNTYPSHGLFGRIRVRLFGERDIAEEQIRSISRQGAGMARVAHTCATALIILFSLGSLVALSGDALQAAVTGWRAGRVDIPSAISIGVSTLLVVCMDTGMIYAASVIRLLSARRAPSSEMRLHLIIMVTVGILEAATYMDMSVTYEHPALLAVWCLIAARAAAAPVLSVYLALARQLPVLPRDILYQVELASGAGVLRDVAVLANNAEAPLSKKLKMYSSASLMPATDRDRLLSLVEAVQSDELERDPGADQVVASGEPRYPTGGGSPQAKTTEPSVPEHAPAPRVTPIKSRRKRSPGKRFLDPAAEEAAGFALLDQWGLGPNGQPRLSQKAFRSQLGINNGRAREIYTKWVIARTPRRIAAPVVVEADVAQ